MILNYDVYRNRLQAIGTLMKWKPYRDSFITLAHFSTQNLPSPPNLEPPGFEFRESVESDSRVDWLRRSDEARV